ncbi:iron complex outermembrane recepter protein [Chitinophaga sp. CF118]|uniref:SusC/RagA family TonB-linked outer membrane protein n=1 Tax=Chitinophaga sp. CF118 TaxID=1884367 RepID=UPI0008EC4E13|nr:SusC/RagA family TonB-linked outer membrane protein [Chitinophaga sp. CF118]SFE06101.1 iron complex outermembrane recepter protein [Chitinophaga sp. CF118]
MNIPMHGKIMRFTAVLLLVCSLQINARSYSQNITYTGKHVSLEKVFAAIKQQTGYLFWYDYKLLKNVQPVDIAVKDATIDQVMSLCLKDQLLTYAIEGKTIIVSAKPATEPVQMRATTPQEKVSGIVRDENGNALPGVSVRVKGALKGTSTAGDGSFSLDAPVGAILVFTFVGMEAKEVPATATSMNIRLQSKAGALSEVVVTGFGESRKSRTLGYAVTQVSGTDIKRANPINPIAALQGMVPGLQVQSGVGGPQASARFLIRGSSSLDPYGNQPLIVLDDIVMDQNVVTPNKASDQDFGNILKDINPDDIESISVLKGGAVTALYGSRASNGVILIKTKKGYSQKGLGVNFSADILSSNPYKTVDLQNQYGAGFGLTDFIKDADGNLSINPSTYPYNFGPEMTGQKVTDITGKVIENNPRPKNMLDAFRNGVTRNYNVALSGATERGTYRLAYSNLYSQGVTPNNDLKRNNLTFRATQRLANVLLVDANATYVQSNALNPANVGGNGTMRNFVYGGARNYDTKYWMSHYINESAGGVNTSDPSELTYVFFNLFQNNNRQIENNFRGSVDLKATLLKGLDWQGNVSVNYIGINWENKKRGKDAGFNSPGYETSTSNTRVERYRTNLNYNTVFNKDFSMLLQAGGEIVTGISKGNYASMAGFVLPDIYRLSNSSGVPVVRENSPNQSQSSSAFGQGSVTFRDYLTLNLYARNDWNSTLIYNDGHGDYSYFYPGADIAFVFTDAFKMPKAFDYGKLRLSYASVGGGTSTYTANTGAYTANSPYNSPAGGNGVVNYQYNSRTLPNQSLSPTSTTKLEAGLEMKWFGNRLGADITYYSQDSKSQIIKFSVPIESGVEATLINGGKVRNQGWEIRLTATPIKTKDFSWDTYFNYTRNRNKVLSLPYNLNFVELGSGDGYQVIAEKGGNYGTVTATYGYAYYKSTDGTHPESNGKRVLNITNAKGSSVYVRAQNYTQGVSQQPVVGQIAPDFLGNWRNNFTYKNWQLGIVMDSKFGGMVYSTTHDLGSWLGSIKSTLPYRTNQTGGLNYTNSAGVAQQNGVIMDGVYKQGTVIMGLDGNTHDLSGISMKEAYDNGWINPTSAYSMYQNTHSWANGIRESSMFTSSWISLQQVTLTYDLSSKVANKFKLNGLRVSLVGNNLTYLYNSAKDHINPENLNSTGSDAMTEGSAMPYIRSFGFSINGSF